MSNLIVGAQLYSIRDKTQSASDMLSALKQIKAIGYNSCQVSGQARDIPFAQIREMLDETGLYCPATHIQFDDMVNDFDQVVANHKALGCTYAGIGGLPERYARSGAEGYVAFAKEASVIAEKLRDNGLSFIYHNHHFEFAHIDGRTTGMDVLLSESSPALLFELDLFWLQAAGVNPLEWIEKVRGRMEVVHFKEMGFGNFMNFSMFPMGKGNMNWKKLIGACDDTGVKYAFIEQDNAVESDSIECMRVSYEYVKSIEGSF